MEHHRSSLMDSRSSMTNEPAVRALQEAIQSQLAVESPTSNVCSAELTRAIRELCTIARQRGFRAEEVILLFKTAWATSPAMASQLEPTRRAELLERAVSLCIKSYYGTAD